MIALALAGLAVVAPPALASPHWNTQIKNASDTASRVAGGCSIDKGSRTGSLLVNCPDHHSATLVYLFTTRHSVQGKPWARVGDTGWGRVDESAQVSGKSIRVTLTVSGHARVQLTTITVCYYTR
ncbi:MAG TPA: hypothetical protein VGI72_04250 [Gaiellales bacterium]|jgi:hypothetical protein